MKNQQYYCFFCSKAIDRSNMNYQDRVFDYCQQQTCKNHFCRKCQAMYLTNANRKVIHYAEENDAICFVCVQNSNEQQEEQNGVLT